MPVSVSSTPRRVSASRLNAIDTCTMQFYLHEILGMPEKQWPRTAAGSATHGVLEALYRDKHRVHHDTIKAAQTIYASPAIKRLVRAWTHKTKMPPEIVADIDAMCLLAVNETNFLDEGAIKRFEPEHEFKLTLRNGGVVKGYIDRLAQYPDLFVIHDYKTARNKHTKDEVAESYQSLVYQLYIWKAFGLLAEVRYYFLRHPPTRTAKTKHIMITPPATVAELQGFELYLEHMYEKVNDFTERDASAGLCSDDGFCRNVCSYYRAMDYLSLKDKSTGALIGNYMLDNPPHVGENQVVERLHCKGCPRFN